MTIGSQLRDIYITKLEDKLQKSPVVLLDDKDIEASTIIQEMVTSAALEPTGEVVKDNFTIRVSTDGSPVQFFALHVFARALKGETTKSKQRDAVGQEKFVKRYAPYVTLLEAKKFSANPKLNEGKTPENIVEAKPPITAVQEETKEKVSA